MKREHWVPVVVFLGVSIPLVLVLNLLNLAGEYRVWIALAAGVAATAYTQAAIRKKKDKAE